MKRYLHILFCFFCVLSFTHGQDVHFSSMDYSPLSLNPGLSGVYSDVRVTGNYRNQWGSVTTPFQTMSGSYDMRFRDNVNQQGYFSFGVNFFNDRAGSNRMSTNNFGLSLAYHLRLNKESHIGLGLQGAFVSRSLSVEDGKWGSQYDGQIYDGNLMSGENFEHTNFNYIDAGTGFVYSYHPQNNSRNNYGSNLLIGIGAYHVNKPRYSFLDGDGDHLYMRFTGFIMAHLGLGHSDMGLEPQLIIQLQGPSTYTYLGSDIRWFLGSGAFSETSYSGFSLAFGLYYRNLDALVSRISVDYSGFSVGMAYDFNFFSSLREVSRFMGGSEIFMRYRINNSLSLVNRPKM